MQRTIAVAGVPVPPSRAGPSRRIRQTVTMLALSVAGTAGAQTAKPHLADSLVAAAPRADSGTPAAATAASATSAAAALPKWFDEIAVNAFVSTAYEYNANRPATFPSSAS